MFNAKYKKILSRVLEKNIPSKKEVQEMKKLADVVISQIKKQGVGAEVGGSLAKNTLVKKDSQDIDIFVQFSSEEDTKDLEKILKKVKTSGKLTCVHGSRDYFRIDFPHISLEIIPTVKCKSPAEANNITDLSISHVKYVTKKTRRNRKLANEIRLAKIFCSASDCYGAESYIQGFSGYALELLVIQFGGFLKFLKRIDKNKTLDPEKLFKNSQEIKRELNASKLVSPIILIDPTYKYRNVTAALGEETYSKFLKYAKEFLRNPTTEAFERKVINKEEIKGYADKTNAKYIEVKIKTKKQEGDIAGTKMKKFFNFCLRGLAGGGQEVLLSEFDYGGVGQKATGYIVVKENKRIEVRGPSLKMEEAAMKFGKARKEVFERGGYLWAMENTSIKRVLNRAKKQSADMDVVAEMRIE